MAFPSRTATAGSLNIPSRQPAAEYVFDGSALVRRLVRGPIFFPRVAQLSESRPTLSNMPKDEHGEKQLGAAAQADEWDARYSEREGARWSGRPNGRLLVEV